MANEPLSALAAQLQADAAKPGGILLNTQYLTGPLGGIAPPPDLDTNLARAFQTGGPGGLQIILTSAAFGPVTSTGFTVSKVALQVLGGTATAATLTFGLTSGGNGQQLTVQIAAPAPGWTWSDLSSAAAGWPFTVAPVSAVSFTFDTTVPGAVQAFSAQFAPPQFFSDVVELVLNFPTGNLAVAGTLDFSAMDAQTVLFPTGVLSAALPAGAGLKLFHLSVANPAFTLTFPAADEDGDQAPLLGFQLDLAVTNNGTPIAGYKLTASVLPPAGTLGSNQIPTAAPTQYSFALSSGPDTAILTPGTLMQLVGGASYFQAVPAEFQQFLTLVGLRGLSLSGAINPPSILQIGAAIGANPATLPWTIFKDSTNELTLEIDDLELAWILANPTSADSYQTVVFTTEITFLPAVFKGTFAFEISSALEFDASFDGTADLHDLVYLASATLISLPSSISGALSDVHFHYSHSSGAYAISAGIAIDLSFVTIGGKSLFTLTAGSVGFSASPPQSGSGGSGDDADDPPKTIYHASFGGLVTIGPVAAMTDIAYDSSSGWNLSAVATAPIDLGDLIAQVFTLGGQYAFPDFLKPDVQITALAVTAAIPAASTEAKNYTVAGSFTWNFKLAGYQISELAADVKLAYDGANFSGSASATLHLDFIHTTLALSYAFDRAKGSSTLGVTWEGVTATYSSGDDKLTFTFANCSVGSLITALVKTIGNPYFTLSAPWDLLDKVSLDGLSVAFELGDDAATPISATYTLPNPIEIGFATIDGLTMSRLKSGQVVMQLDGDSPLLSLPNVDPRLLKLFGRGEDGAALTDDAATGQDVTDLPDVPGRGNDYFKLCLFTMGQRVSITGLTSEPDVKTLIADMSNVPSTDGNANPVVAGGGGLPKGTPYYDRSSDWLIAAHMLILKAGDDWTVDLSFVFHDSDLYGLHLEMAGGKAKALAGLEIDILYKKVTDEIGMYQVDWRFPDYVRNLNFGAVSVVLPDIGVQIYTNGDFLIDIGFPYNMDFSHSFSFSAIIAGIPVTGGGGVYFGKLSGATSTFTPVTTLGTFDPVIAFGIGFQIGLGYNFTAGPLTAGFSLTAFAIIEGVIATWHPYTLPANPGSSVQHDYYFKISGTAGIIGLLYGSIDFAIIKASLSVNITLSISLTYESFQPIDIVASASVTVSLSVSIDLGLFSITFHLHFHAEASASFVIHVDDGTAPWIAGNSGNTLLARPAALVQMLAAPRPRGQAKRLLRTAADTNALTLYAAAAFTVTAAETETNPANQSGAFVAMLMMDAPSASGTGGAGNGPTSFDTLCQNMLPWLVDHLAGAEGDTLDVDAAGSTVVSPDMLRSYMALLADLASPPLGFSDYLTFLSSFTVSISSLAANPGKLDGGSVPFPVFDGLTVTPKLNGNAGTTIDFSQWVAASPGYREGIAALFATLAASLQQAGGPPPSTAVHAPRTVVPPVTESMAAILFVDAMMLVGRQLLQAAVQAFDHFQYPLSNGNTIASIIAWSVTGESPIHSDDIVLPNASTALAAGSSFTLGAPPYTIRNGDTLQSIAAGFPSGGQINPASLIGGNPNARVVAAGTAITVSGQPQPYLTPAGISFIDLQTALGMLDPAPHTPWTPEQLATAIGTQACLVAGEMIDPPATVDTVAGDTLAALAARYGVTVSSLGANSANASITLFDTTANTAVPLANITRAAVKDLWTTIVAQDQVAQTAGMMSRFLSAGLRLPVSTAQGALALSAGFTAANPAQDRYGLYQLTGQQVAAAAAAPTSYDLVFSRLDAVGPINLGFITFDGPSNTSSVDLTGAFAFLAPVLASAQAGAFNPATSFRILPAAARSPQVLGLSAAVGFVSADPTAIATITAPPQLTGQSGTPLPQPILWALPASLLADVAARQAAFDAAAIGYAAQLPYLPALEPLALTTDPVTKAPIQTALSQYAWATRVEFSVKRLPPTPPGAPLAKTRAFTYEVLALNATQASLLERLVSALAEPISGQAISALFLAFQQGSGSTAQLLAQADPASPAFFSRSNLSTQSNPGFEAFFADAEAPPPPPPPPLGNVANPPEQVARLLWELSTVRSGGYFLSYDLLPDSAFDSTGKADLCILFTYPRGGALTQDRLTAFVNALLTDDPIAGPGVQVAVMSESAPTAAQPVTAASLAQLAALYGLSVGRIAELNSTFPLVPGVTIAVGGVTHLITAAEAQGTPTAIWARIAGEYSPALTGDQVSAANPNVTPAAGVALYIPTIAYPTAAGDTLQSIAAAFGISIDDLATSAATAPILTSPSATGTPADLTIDPQALDVHPSDAPGNITFELQRPALDPSNTGDAVLARLYSMLAAGVQANRFYDASDGPPFGPQHHDDPMNPATVRLAAARRRALSQPAQRRAILAASTDAPLYYRQALGLAAVATSNVAPSGGSGGVPPGTANPYIGVGTLAQLELEWRDLFGNILVDQFGAPPSGYSGPVSGQVAPLLYRDKLIGPAAWPNMAIEYWYEQGGLSITLSLSTKAYDSDGETVKRRIDGNVQDVPAGQAAAQRDYELYSRIWFQLNQDYASAGIPWATGQAVQFSLHNGLLAQPDLPLGDSQAQTFRNFVEQVLGYLDQRRQGNAGTVPVVPALVIPIDVDQGVAAGDILPLALTLTLSRQGLLVDSALAGLADAETSSVDLLPIPDATDASGSGYSGFAQKFETMFVSSGGGWTMRVGTSSAGGASQGGDKRTQSLWAVRFADTPLTGTPQGLGFSLGDLPLYYAPLPLASSLLSTTISLYPAFDNTQPFPPADPQVVQTFTGVDPGVWFQTVLDAVDAALAPDLAAALFLLDRSNGIADPLTDGTLGQLLTIKQSLADDIAATVRPILEPADGTSPWPTPDDASEAAAAATLRQALLSQLGPAFSTTAIVAFPASQVAGPAAGAGGPVNLYGKACAAFVGTAGPDVNATFALSSARLPLDPSQPARLAFLLDSKNQTGAGTASYLPLTLTWDITHVEHAIRSIPGIDGYVDSDWIGFITPFAPTPFNNGAEIDVPVLLRALPQPPTMRGQAATATYPAPTSPGELAEWDYSVDFTDDRVAQDSISTRIDFNTDDSGGGLHGAPPDNPAADALYAALAQFVQVYPAVDQAMTAALDAITGTGAAADAPATIPVQWFLKTLDDVRKTYNAWAHPPELMSDAVPLPPRARVEFEITLDPANPDAPAVVTIGGLAINGQPATLNADLASITSTAAGITLPLPFVQILPEQWAPKVISNAGLSDVSFNYLPVSPAGNGAPAPTPMKYKDAEATSARSITMSGLNIFGYRNGSATLQILRNEHLLPGSAPPAKTNPVFIFSTPAVQFASPVAPSLAFGTFPIDGLQSQGSSYRSYLGAFFTGLAANTPGEDIEAAATVTYSYSLIPGQAQPRTVVPVALLLHTPDKLSATAPPAFVAPLAAMTDQWRINNDPTTGGEGELAPTIDLALAIYPAGDGNLQPMLRVASVSLNAANAPPVKPEP